MKKYIIFDLDGTLINSNIKLKDNVFSFFKEHQPEYFDILRYSIDFQKITNVKDIFIKIFGKFEKEEEKIYNKLQKFLDKENNKSIFIDGTIEKIIELKDKYKLYLTTRTSTSIATQILKSGGIDIYFEKILGGDITPKSEEHLDIFLKHSQDDKFFIRSVYIGDGINDRIFANNKNIRFIKVGEKYRSIKDINII